MSNNSMQWLLQRAKRSDIFVERRMERPASNLFGKTYVPDVSPVAYAL
jgi:hypothetical protein